MFASIIATDSLKTNLKTNWVYNSQTRLKKPLKVTLPSMFKLSLELMSLAKQYQDKYGCSKHFSQTEASFIPGLY